MDNISSITVGEMVAVGVAEGIAPHNLYLGAVEAVDVMGLRLALQDIKTDKKLGYSLFLPWDAVLSILISPAGGDGKRFSQDVRQWWASVSWKPSM